MVAQHNGISMIRCFCSEAAIGHAQKQGFVRGQKVQSNCTDGGLLVYQLVDQLRIFLKPVRPVSATPTRLYIGSPAFPTTNQKAGGSNRSGRATILSAYFLASLLLRELGYAVRC